MTLSGDIDEGDRDLLLDDVIAFQFSWLGTSKEGLWSSASALVKASEVDRWITVRPSTCDVRFGYAVARARGIEPLIGVLSSEAAYADAEQVEFHAQIGSQHLMFSVLSPRNNLEGSITLRGMGARWRDASERELSAASVVLRAFYNSLGLFQSIALRYGLRCVLDGRSCTLERSRTAV